MGAELKLRGRGGGAGINTEEHFLSTEVRLFLVNCISSVFSAES